MLLVFLVLMVWCLVSEFGCLFGELVMGGVSVVCFMLYCGGVEVVVLRCWIVLEYVLVCIEVVYVLVLWCLL